MVAFAALARRASSQGRLRSDTSCRPLRSRICGICAATSRFGWEVAAKNGAVMKRKTRRLPLGKRRERSVSYATTFQVRSQVDHRQVFGALRGSELPDGNHPLDGRPPRLTTFTQSPLRLRRCGAICGGEKKGPDGVVRPLHLRPCCGSGGGFGFGASSLLLSDRAAPGERGCDSQSQERDNHHDDP